MSGIQRDQPEILEAVRRLCAARGIEPLDVLEDLGQHLDEILPSGCQISECGSCGRKSVVPTGESLRALRDSHGISQGAIARAAGCTKQHVCAIERGRCYPNATIVAAYEKLAAEVARGGA